MKIQNIKTIEVNVNGTVIRAAVAHGGAAAAKVIEIEKELKVDVIEVMICPMGCQNGGGQPKQMKKELISKRAEALDKHDKGSSFGDCESNQLMHQYIDQYMPTEQEVHEVFHTHF